MDFFGKRKQDSTGYPQRQSVKNFKPRKKKGQPTIAFTNEKEEPAEMAEPRSYWGTHGR